MTRSNPWSGMAPAVDAHIGRWSISDRCKGIAAGFLDTEHHREFEVAWRNPWVGRWIQFAASYGIPDENGDPVIEALPGRGLPFPAIDTDGASAAPVREQFSADQTCGLQGCALALREAAMLTRSTTHYVSAEVLDEIDTATALMEAEPLRLTDLVCPSGLAFFERPIEVRDLDPENGGISDDLWVQLRVVGWDMHDGIYSQTDDTFGPGVTLFLYTTPRDTLDGYWTDLIGSGRQLDEMDWARHQALVDEDPMTLVPLDVIPWRFDTPWRPRDEIGPFVPGTVPTPVGHERRWFLAFMRLMWQEIIVSRPHHPNRAEQRRWDRLAGRKMLLDYTTLRLRRIVDPAAASLTGTGVPLDHRVLVRGHWRRQWVQSLGPARNPDGSWNDQSHRLVWIEQHWRGPEDGPIGAMGHATAVTR